MQLSMIYVKLLMNDMADSSWTINNSHMFLAEVMQTIVQSQSKTHVISVYSK